MDQILSYLKKPLTVAIIGFLIGLIIGLPILGWWILPVKWTDAAVNHLRPDLKEDYLRMAISTYAFDRNKAAALQRWENLGKDANDIMDQVIMDPNLDSQAIADFITLVEGGAVVVPTALPGETAVPTLSIKETAVPGAGIGKEGNGISTTTLLIISCGLLLLVGAVLVYILFLRKRPGGGISLGKKAAVQPEDVELPEYEDEGQDAPSAHFMTSYNLGDDLYDDSFSIDSPAGEFLGECGVGISETIGVGDPKKVTAFEVWLFDKNDIQTVTKVLMSEHAFNDPNISQRLASKGEPVIVDTGKRILLETATLQLEARITEFNYGQGAMPQNSFFDRLTLELVIWPKQ
jgi:hypothetical protein